MRVSNRRRRLEKNTSRNLIEIYERLRFAANVDEQTWLDIVRLTSTEYEKIRDGVKELPATTLAHVADGFHLNISSLVSGKIDYRAVSEQFRGNSSYVPERYMVGAFSKRLTVRNILNYLQETSGWRFADDVRRHIQIHPAALHDVDMPININAMLDIYRYLRTERNFKDRSFRAIGEHSAVTMLRRLQVENETPFAQTVQRILSQAKTMDQFWEIIVLELPTLFEKNCTYRILKLSKSKCLLVSVASAEAVEALKVKRVGSLEGCLVRAGICSTFPSYLGLRPSTVIETRCVHRGDSACIFEIDYSNTLDYVSNNFENKPLRRVLLN